MNPYGNHLVGPDYQPEVIPDPVVMCKCGKAEPLQGHDDCFECTVAWALANPEEHDDNCDMGYGDNPTTKRVVDAVNAERLRRFAARETVYHRRTA